MSAEGQIPGQSAGGRQPTEEELRAAYEAELKQIKVGDVLLQTAVSLVNLGGRRAGLAPESEDERDLDQLRDAIDAVRALLPVLERSASAELGPVRNALSQLQVAYARGREAGEPSGTAEGPAASDDGPGAARPAGAQAATEPGAADQRQPPGPGPAQSSGRLWVPGR